MNVIQDAKQLRQAVSDLLADNLIVLPLNQPRCLFGLKGYSFDGKVLKEAETALVITSPYRKLLLHALLHAL